MTACSSCGVQCCSGQCVECRRLIAKVARGIRVRLRRGFATQITAPVLCATWPTRCSRGPGANRAPRDARPLTRARAAGRPRRSRPRRSRNRSLGWGKGNGCGDSSCSNCRVQCGDNASVNGGGGGAASLGLSPLWAVCCLMGKMTANGGRSCC